MQISAVFNINKCVLISISIGLDMVINFSYYINNTDV